jgi:hypothetical protein
LYIVIYKKSISEVNQNNYTCQVLNDRLTEENFLSTNTDSFHCDPGKLGEICEVKCENILGRKHKFCEEHRIYHGTKCRCAWGSTLSDANKIHCSKSKLTLAITRNNKHSEHNIHFF